MTNHEKVVMLERENAKLQEENHALRNDLHTLKLRIRQMEQRAAGEA